MQIVEVAQPGANLLLKGNYSCKAAAVVGLILSRKGQMLSSLMLEKLLMMLDRPLQSVQLNTESGTCLAARSGAVGNLCMRHSCKLLHLSEPRFEHAHSGSHIASVFLKRTFLLRHEIFAES